jgi:RNA polymerase sigma-70 factor, ECF subfamily
MIKVLRKLSQQCLCVTDAGHLNRTPIRKSESMPTDERLSLEMLLPRLWTFALRLTGSRRLAETLVMRTYARAFRNARARPDDQEPLVRLLTILHAEWVHGMSARRHQGLADLSIGLHGAPSQQEECAVPIRILGAVDRLPDPQRSILLMVHVESLTVECAAMVVGIQPSQAQRYLIDAYVRVGRLTSGFI